MHLSYPDPNYNTRVNYYSSPDIADNYIPTGDVNNNNAALLVQRRLQMQAVGNEATACPAESGKNSGNL
jgi:hypothetical protein